MIRTDPGLDLSKRKEMELLRNGSDRPDCSGHPFSVYQTDAAHSDEQQPSMPVTWRLTHLFVILAVGFVFTLPLLIYGMPYLSDDGGSHHAVWYLNFSQQLWAGDLYPRWLVNMNSGLGSPVFFYYPPLPYYLTSLLRPFFSADSQGLYQLGVSACLALIASGWTAYLWLKDITDRNSALIAAILYMTMPYHVAADLYVRGAFAEYWAFVWLPSILYFTARIRPGHRSAAVGLALSYALLIMTHLPTTLIFSVVPVCYAFFISDLHRRVKVLTITICAMMLGIGLSAIYLLPAMATQKFVFLDRNSLGYFSYESWLLFGKHSLWAEDRVGMILLVFDMVCVAGIAFLVARSGLNTHLRRLSAFWLGVAMASVFMMTELSKPVWLIFPTLQKIQFSWRFNVILSLATAALLALAISSIKNLRHTSQAIVLTSGLLCIIAWIPATVWAARNAFPEANFDQGAINEVDEIIRERRDVPEYRPRASGSLAKIDWNLSRDINHWDSLLNGEFASLLQRVYESGETLPQVKVVAGAGHVSINCWKPREISLLVASSAGLTLDVSQFYYPGWTAHLVEETAVLKVEPSKSDGLIELTVPSGDHQVLLQLERSRWEKAGLLISALSVAMLPTFLLLPFFTREHQ